MAPNTEHIASTTMEVDDQDADGGIVCLPVSEVNSSSDTENDKVKSNVNKMGVTNDVYGDSNIQNPKEEEIGDKHDNENTEDGSEESEGESSSDDGHDSSSDDDDSSSSEDDDDNADKDNQDNNGLSDYERLRLERIKRNQERLAQLGLLESGIKDKTPGTGNRPKKTPKVRKSESAASIARRSQPKRSAKSNLTPQYGLSTFDVRQMRLPSTDSRRHSKSEKRMFSRRYRCEACTGCTREDDCHTCVYCVQNRDLPTDTKSKRRCLFRVCLRRLVVVDAEAPPRPKDADNKMEVDNAMIPGAKKPKKKKVATMMDCIKSNRIRGRPMSVFTPKNVTVADGGGVNNNTADANATRAAGAQAEKELFDEHQQVQHHDEQRVINTTRNIIDTVARHALSDLMRPVDAALTELGWDIERRSGKKHYFPPGDGWHSNKPRLNTVTKVMKFLKTDETWKENEVVKTVVETFDAGIEEESPLPPPRRIEPMMVEKKEEEVEGEQCPPHEAPGNTAENPGGAAAKTGAEATDTQEDAGAPPVEKNQEEASQSTAPNAESGNTEESIEAKTQGEARASHDDAQSSSVEKKGGPSPTKSKTIAGSGEAKADATSGDETPVIKEETSPPPIVAEAIGVSNTIATTENEAPLKNSDAGDAINLDAADMMDIDQSSQQFDLALSPSKKLMAKPKRPMSAYNIYFKEQRALMLSDIPDENGEYRGHDEGIEESGKRKKSHGKIGFQELARIIGASWKELPTELVDMYKKLADDEMTKYRKAKAEWELEQQQQRKANEALYASHAATVEKPVTGTPGVIDHAPADLSKIGTNGSATTAEANNVSNDCCHVCSKKGDLICCDGCNRGYHSNCHSKPIREIPLGEWFCAECKPKRPPKAPRERREKVQVNLNLFEGEHDDDCYICFNGGELVCCDFCPKAFHCACHIPPLPFIPSGVWKCCECSAVERTKKSRCGECEACTRDDCGKCIYCLDKPKFGGPNIKKQVCLKRVCPFPRFAPPASSKSAAGEIVSISKHNKKRSRVSIDGEIAARKKKRLEPDIDVAKQEIKVQMHPEHKEEASDEFGEGPTVVKFHLSSIRSAYMDSDSIHIRKHITHALKDPENSKTQDKAIELLRKHIATAENVKKVLLFGGVEMICKAMIEHPDKTVVQAEACCTLAEILWVYPRVSTKLVHAGAIDLIISAMNRLNHNPKVQQMGCAAFRALSYDGESVKDITESAISSVILSMERNPNKLAVQKEGCYFLQNMLVYSTTNVEAVSKSQVVAGIVPALTNEQFLVDEEFLQSACGLLANLALDEQAQVAVGKSGAISALIKTLNTTDDIEAKQASCSALKHLAMENSDNQARMLQEGCLEAVFTAITGSFSHDPVLLAAAFGVMKELCIHDEEVARKIMKMGGIKILLKTMTSFPDLAMIQAAACAVIGYLIYDNKDKDATKLTNAIITAMKNHDDTGLVQIEACDALTELSHVPAVCNILKEATIQKLLERAKRHFPPCESDVDDIIAACKN